MRKKEKRELKVGISGAASSIGGSLVGAHMGAKVARPAAKSTNYIKTKLNSSVRGKYSTQAQKAKSLRATTRQFKSAAPKALGVIGLVAGATVASKINSKRESYNRNILYSKDAVKRPKKRSPLVGIGTGAAVAASHHGLTKPAGGFLKTLKKNKVNAVSGVVAGAAASFLINKQAKSDHKNLKRREIIHNKARQ